MKEHAFVAYRRITAPLRGRGLRRYVPLLDRLDRALVRRFQQGAVDVRGRKLFLDPGDFCGYGTQLFESFATDVVSALVKPGQVVIDIGAHIGYYTVLFSELVGPRGRVFAFEPDPDNFQLLQRNVRLNGCRNVVLERKAVSDTSGPLKLYRATINTGDHRLFDITRDRVAIPIAAVRLDDYFSDPPARLDFIKADIQGTEGAALRGMSSLLDRYERVMLFTEFAPFLLAPFGDAPESYLRALERQNRFTIYEVDESTRRLERADIVALVRKYPVDTERYTNLLCVRGEHELPFTK